MTTSTTTTTSNIAPTAAATHNEHVSETGNVHRQRARGIESVESEIGTTRGVSASRCATK
jgi:hypothetical protein